MESVSTRLGRGGDRYHRFSFMILMYVYEGLDLILEAWGLGMLSCDVKICLSKSIHTIIHVTP